MTVMQEHEIRKLKERIKEMEFQKLTHPFTLELGEALAFLMACTTPKLWTKDQQSAFEATRKKYPTIADEWKRRVFQYAKQEEDNVK